MAKTIENNQVRMVGRIVADFTYSHAAHREGFYRTRLEVGRLSDTVDTIPVMVSEHLIDWQQEYSGYYMGQMVEISGQVRSFTHGDGKKACLEVYIFVTEINVLDHADEKITTNDVYLCGYTCKQPIYRQTPFGMEITDLFLAVNRPYGKCDYIPCIAWGRNARYSAKFGMGALVNVWGRMQSREYTKKIGDSELETHVVYEISANQIECQERGRDCETIS